MRLNKIGNQLIIIVLQMLQIRKTERSQIYSRILSDACYFVFFSVFDLRHALHDNSKKAFCCSVLRRPVVMLLL